jgi:hypothetical protein
MLGSVHSTPLRGAGSGDMNPNARLAILVVLAALLLVLGLDVGRLVLAPTRGDSIDAVRVRNAMVARLGTPDETEWRPDAVPLAYRWERLPAPRYFADVVARLQAREGRQGTALATAVELARHLRKDSRQGPPIQANTRETYETILAGKGGYCSDYTQSFTALALAAGLAVREWGFAWEDMANGHAFNEVWEPVLQKWVLIDSFVSFYVVDRISGIPLSALEFRDALLSGRDAGELQVVQIVPERFGFKSVERALAWYRRGLPRLFLVLGNGVYSYDANPAIQLAEALPRSAEMAVAILLGEHPRFLFVPWHGDPEVTGQVRAMDAELLWLLAKLAALLLIGVAFAILLWSFAIRRQRTLPAA